MFLSKGVGLLRPILLFLLNEGISGMESDASQNKTEHLFMFMHNGFKHEILVRKKSFFWYVPAFSQDIHENIVIKEEK